MTNEQLVSIVTPSYNQGRFIEDTIASVANQDYPNVEHIIQDGGSDDGTVQVLEAWEHRAGLDWVSEPDEGQSDAINKGFEKAEGEIVAWLNSDDCYVTTDAISSVVDSFRRHPDVDVLYGNIIHIDGDNELIDAKVVRHPFDRELLHRACFLEQPAVFFRREVIQAEPLRTDLEVAMDYEYWLRLAESFTFRHLNKILAADRIHADRKSVALSGETQSVSDEIRRDYGFDGEDVYGHLGLLDRLTSGFPRRVEATRQLIDLGRREDLAFELRCPSRHRAILRQWRTGIRNVLPS